VNIPAQNQTYGGRIERVNAPVRIKPIGVSSIKKPEKRVTSTPQAEIKPTKTAEKIQTAENVENRPSVWSVIKGSWKKLFNKEKDLPGNLNETLEEKETERLWLETHTPQQQFAPGTKKTTTEEPRNPETSHYKWTEIMKEEPKKEPGKLDEQWFDENNFYDRNGQKINREEFITENDANLIEQNLPEDTEEILGEDGMPKNAEERKILNTKGAMGLIRHRKEKADSKK